MKRNLVFFLTLFIILVVNSCEQPIDPLNDKGTIFVDSDPAEASIYIDGKNSGIFTPGEVQVISGIHFITLKKVGYADYKFSDTVTIGSEKIHSVIN